MSSSLRLDWCSYEAARFACEHWHYSGRLISTYTRPVYIGVWEAGHFIGAVVFSHGVNKNIGSPYGLNQFACCELVRIALAPHQASVSRIVAIALRLLRRQSPGIRLVVSYSDTAQGHLGGIYQAGNWFYVGAIKGAVMYQVNGRAMHQRAVDCSMGTRKGLAGAIPALKHKYLMPLDAEMRAKVAPLAKPYPKRAASVYSDTPGHQPGEGGAEPTAALQTLEASR